MVKVRQWWRRQMRARKLKAEQKAQAEADSGDGKKPSVGPPGLLDRLKEQVKKQATKLKEKMLAGRKLLKNLTKLNPADLAKALGPALAIAGAAAGVATAVALPLYAVANEREDERQIEDSELAALQARVDEAEAALATVPGFDDIPALPSSTAPTTTVAVADLGPSVDALADRLGDLEGLDVVESPALADIQSRIDDLTVPTATTIDLTPIEEQAASAAQAANDAADAADQARLTAASNTAGVAALEAAVNDLDALTDLSDALDEAQTETAAVVAELEDTVLVASARADAAQLTADDALAEAVLAAEGVDTAQMTADEAVDAAAEALDAAVPFDPSTLEAADAANLAAAQAAATAAADAQTAAEDALTEAEAAADEIEAIETDLADVSTAFFTQLTADYAQGVPINMTSSDCTHGSGTHFLRAGPGAQLFNGVRTLSTGGEACKQFIPVIPALPAACSFPAVGSAQVRFVGFANVSVTVSGAGTAVIDSKQGSFGSSASSGSSGFLFASGVTEAMSYDFDTFQFYRYDGTRTPYFQIYVYADVISQQFSASAMWTDATFTASINCT